MEELTPTALSERIFSRAIRGYQPTEVDAYIDRVSENYAALYRENTELNRQLSEANEQLAAARAEEESVRATLERAKEAQDAIIQEAYLRADEILNSVEGNCAAILADFRAKIEKEQAVLADLRRQTQSFKKELYEKYRLHIEAIEALIPDEIPEDELTPDGYAAKVITDLKEEIAAQYDIAPEPTAEKAGDGTELPTQRESVVYHSNTADSSAEKKKKENAPSVMRILDDEDTSFAKTVPSAF